VSVVRTILNCLAYLLDVQELEGELTAARHETQKLKGHVREKKTSEAGLHDELAHVKEVRMLLAAQTWQVSLQRIHNANLVLAIL
jgi:hypothetical protein